MTGAGDLDRRIAEWMAEERHVASRDAFTVAAARTAGVRPRPRVVAALGSHWVDGTPARLDRYTSAAGSRIAFAGLAILVALALVGIAMLAAGQFRQRHPVLGTLAYSRDGSVYLLPAQGASPLRIGEGMDPQWSPDGRFLLFWSSTSEETIHVLDRAGVPVAAFPGWLPGWSPDSTRIASWAGPGIEVRTLRGELLQTVLVPPNLVGHGDNEVSWTCAGDGIVLAHYSDGGTVVQAWVLPLHGEQARPLDAAVKGTWYACSTASGLAIAAADGLYVSDGHGAPARRVTPPNTGRYEAPLWSPSGDRVAVGWNGAGAAFSSTSVVVVEVSTGHVTLVFDAGHGGVRPNRWSADGSTLVVLEGDSGIPTKAWSVAANGSGSELILDIGDQADGADSRPIEEESR